MANTAARKERIRVRREAALQDVDYAVLACARLDMIELRAIAMIRHNRPVFGWFLHGQRVDASLKRLHKLGWLRLYPNAIRFKDDAPSAD